MNYVIHQLVLAISTFLGGSFGLGIYAFLISFFVSSCELWTFLVKLLPDFSLGFADCLRECIANWFVGWKRGVAYISGKFPMFPWGGFAAFETSFVIQK